MKWNMLILAACLALPACGGGPKPLYGWGDYQKSLVSFYKQPDRLQAFADELHADIVKAEAHRRVAPGMYAEYGYALYQLGRTEEAKAAFASEKARWPESAYLMDRMISRVDATPAASAQ